MEHVRLGARVLTLASPGTKILKTPPPNSSCFFKTCNRNTFGLKCMDESLIEKEGSTARERLSYRKE